MPDTTRLKLTGHQARGSPGAGTWVALIVGDVFFLAGLAMICIARGVLPLEGKGLEGQGRRALALFGGVFAAVGLLVSIRGAVGLARRAKARRTRVLHPDEPWLADHDWNPEGVTHSALRKAFGGFAFAAMWFGLLSVFHAVVPAGMQWFLLIFDAAGAVVVGYAIYLVLRYLKYGRSVLSFERFPFFLGETFDATFTNNKGIGFFRRLSFTWRCVEEVYETHGTGKNRRTQAVCYQIYGDTREIDQPGQHSGWNEPVPVSFPIPADQPPTALASGPPSYWELEIHADTPGIDYRATFLVPVYAPPGRP